ncbi:hypothetical protein BYT27DRAFT_7261321 [Phlegmacium glaucopus]|nr:hypothetical protein BYT27DRAFT_7261321 [Phlegmacium glaucopus]
MLPVEMPPQACAEGFLMDLEFARVERPSLDTIKTITVPPVPRPGGGMTAPTVRSYTVFGPDVMRGAAMTPSSAAPILRAIVTKKGIEHEPRHDIESFIYVLAYSLARRAVLESRSLDGEMRKNLHEFFYSTFGRMKLYDIWTSRKGQEPLSIHDLFPTLISAPMVELLHNLDNWLTRSKLPSEWNPEPLTHTYVLSVLDKAIGKMV